MSRPRNGRISMMIAHAAFAAGAQVAATEHVDHRPNPEDEEQDDGGEDEDADHVVDPTRALGAAAERGRTTERHVRSGPDVTGRVARTTWGDRASRGEAGVMGVRGVSLGFLVAVPLAVVVLAEATAATSSWADWATPVGALPARSTDRPRSARVRKDAPDPSCSAGQGVVWYTATAPRRGPMLATVTAGGDSDAALVVYRLVRSKAKELLCVPTDRSGSASVPWYAYPGQFVPDRRRAARRLTGRPLPAVGRLPRAVAAARPERRSQPRDE